MRQPTPVFLALSALLWTPYGVYCFFRPGYLAEAASVSAGSVTALVELRAMYGGLQAAIGLLAGLGTLQRSLRRPALVALVFACAGLGLARLAGALMARELSAYTTAALAFELTSAAVAAWCLRREPA